jgi:hypothetical protein
MPEDRLVSIAEQVETANAIILEHEPPPKPRGWWNRPKHEWSSSCPSCDDLGCNRKDWALNVLLEARLREISRGT